MNLIVPMLMLVVPGIIAVSIHNGRLIHVTRENWQSLMWTYLIYTFAIVFVSYFIMFLNDPERGISFSPWTTGMIKTTERANDVLQVGFVFKYTLFAVAAAIILPKLWAKRHFVTKRKKFKIADDE